MAETLTGYKLSLLSGIIIIVPLVASYFYFRELNPVIAAIGGLLLSIPIKFFWMSYTRPVLKIKEDVEKPTRKSGDASTIHLWEYLVNQVKVENVGKSAARNCKGYIVADRGKERVFWADLPEGRTNATINVEDVEKLDFCAFYNGDYDQKEFEEKREVPKIIALTEANWRENPFNCRNLEGIKTCEILVTAANAEPVTGKIKFYPEEKRIEIVPMKQK